MVMEGELEKKLGERRRNKEVESLRGHAVICGFGRMGQIIARELELGDHPFVVVWNRSPIAWSPPTCAIT